MVFMLFSVLSSETMGGNDSNGMLCCPGPKLFSQAGAGDDSNFESKCSVNELCMTVTTEEQKRRGRREGRRLGEWVLHVGLFIISSSQTRGVSAHGQVPFLSSFFFKSL